MTQPPDNVRRIDRAPQAKKHVGPFYGDQFRRVLAPEVTDPSLIERIAEWYGEMTTREVIAVMVTVALAVMFAALIVV